MLWLAVGVAARFAVTLGTGLDSAVAIYLSAWMAAVVIRGRFSQSSEMESSVGIGQSVLGVVLRLCGMRQETVDRISWAYKWGSHFVNRLLLFSFAFFLAHAIIIDFA